MDENAKYDGLILRPKNDGTSWIDYSWLDLGDFSSWDIRNPLLERTDWDRQNPGLHEVRLMKNKDYLSYAVKTLMSMDGYSPLELLPMQSAIIEELWQRAFPMFIASRGAGKTTLLAIYSLLRSILCPGTKVVAVGAGFRQSKLVFEKVEEIWNNSPILRSVCDNHSGPKREPDKWVMRLNDSSITALPVGDGQKIRGHRANVILADEYGSMSPEIYEVVISGFAAVESTPVKGVKESHRRTEMLKLNLWDEEREIDYQARQKNQSIISGTASWHFNHFYDYWMRYKRIIESRGDEEKLREVLGNEISEHFHWQDYSIIRIPYELIPRGFMNDAIVARAKATAGSDAYKREYSACFTKDSDGFFRRSLIEKRVTSEKNPAMLPSGEVWFDAMIAGNPSKEYVFAVDPSIGSAIEGNQTDNFSITIIELNPDHNRVVYCWSTNRNEFKKRKSIGLTKESQFYGFCARKIRDLMASFNCVHLSIDAQGGGVLLYEALNDKNNKKENEHDIWEIVDEKKEKPSDFYTGLHIIELCQFARYEWLREANYGLHKDLTDGVLLFPRYDAVTLGIAAEEDAIRLRELEKKNPNKKIELLDTFEDCVMEIEELKNEMTSIIVTVTGTGVNARERWDTPEVQLPGGKKGRLRKDRYSALLMANMAARQKQRTVAPAEFYTIGGRVGQIDKKKGKLLYEGPNWYSNVTADCVKILRRS